MKILYAVQATGNGHLSRAREIVPILQQYGTIDLAVSGTQADVQLPFPILHKKQGVSFIYGKTGGIDWWQTFRNVHIATLLNDTLHFPLNGYDLIFNDFEPVVAWACHRKGLPCIGLSHQGAFLSERTPRPAKRQFSGEFVLKYFAPTSKMVAFHFDKYDDFIHTPVIRQEVRTAPITQNDHIAVYLPAVADEILINYFSKIKEIRWHIFSKRTKKTVEQGNVLINPISNEGWIRAASSAEGVLMGAGFEGPAEALFQGKKLMVMPIIGQYEQACNAVALEQMGVRVFRKIKPDFDGLLRDWLHNVQPIRVSYPDETAEIIAKIMENKR
jgi:uncharacterized protein (TIGR00661 family)